MWIFGANNEVVLSFLGILCPLQTMKSQNKKQDTIVIQCFDTCMISPWENIGPSC